MPSPLPSAALILALVCTAPAHAGGSKPFDAASLPVPDVCPNAGIRLAGSENCLRLSGRVRVETTVSSGGFRSGLTHGAASGLRTVGTVAVDVRAPTEFGPIRAYAEIRTVAGRSR